MNIEQTVAKLVAEDRMPPSLANDLWTVPEGMDEPWDSLGDLLDIVDGLHEFGIQSAEWIGGDQGLVLTFFADGDEVRESFQPIPPNELA